MKKLFPLVALFLLFLHSYDINAQKLSPKDQKRVNEVFKKGTVVYFKFQISSIQELNPLSKIISIDRTEGKMVFAHTNKDGFSNFIVKGYPYTVIKVANPAVKTKKVKK